MLRSLPAVLLVMVVLRQPGADYREPVRNNNAWCYDFAMS
jgi:hypothetical protein